MKYLIYVLFILITSFSARSQTIYHFSYSFPNNDKDKVYQAFFVRHDDGTGFVRVYYQPPGVGERLLVEMKLQEDYFINNAGEVDTTKLVYKASSPVLLQGNDNKIPVPFFWFSKDSTGFFEPSAVSISEDTAAQYQGTFFKKEFVKTAANLNKRFVSNFFNESDPFYVNFFGVRSRGNKEGHSNIKMYVVVVANTNDSSIGPSCNKDMNKMLDVFNSIADNMGVKVPAGYPKTIYGENYNLKNIQKTIKDIRPAANDIIVFYYSGHGFRKDPDPRGKPIPYQKSKYPFLDFRANPGEDYNSMSMNVEEIYTLLKNKNARFTLVLSDCCNNIPGETNRKGRPIGGAPRGAALDWSDDNIESLFLNPKRISVLATAADVGQLATGANSFGGFFSYFFKTSMETNFSVFKSNVTWQKVIDEAAEQTGNRVRQSHCGEPPTEENRCKQNPFYIVKAAVN